MICGLIGLFALLFTAAHVALAYLAADPSGKHGALGVFWLLIANMTWGF